MSNGYQVTSHFWQLIDHWQALIAGVLAVAAGVITVIGTRSATRLQIKAMKENTERQLAAAREELERAAAGVRLAERLDCIRASKIATATLRSLAEGVRQRLGQFSHNDPEGELSGPVLEEIRDIPVLEMGKLRTAIGDVNPQILPQFDRLFLDLQSFGAAHGGTHVGPLKQRLDGFLERIAEIISEIESSVSSYPEKRWG